MCDKPPMLFVPVDGPAVEIPADADVARVLDAKDEQRARVSWPSSRPASSTETWSAKRKNDASPFGAAA
jgi:hypothetical protein